MYVYMEYYHRSFSYGIYLSILKVYSVYRKSLVREIQIINAVWISWRIARLFFIYIYILLYDIHDLNPQHQRFSTNGGYYISTRMGKTSLIGNDCVKGRMW